MRITGARMSRVDAEGCETSFDEFYTPGRITERQRNRDPSSHSG